MDQGWMAHSHWWWPIYSSSQFPISRINNVKKSIGQLPSSCPVQPPAKKYHSQVIPTTPRNFQLVLSTIPPPSPNTSIDRPSLDSPFMPSCIPHPRPSPMLTSKHLQPMA
ncbi:hypothetical protein O181_123837 [Austropuccinia psidii MF-1]|uniref:Uncharacterized protein n=1 Tax=Austropuccinia psidii MF-1 TaxID=1389203 RepID=A0A9Q3Q5U6_9BASI|nr:hypothetical protein [Austropuccinia psidii MF-1]